MNTDRPTEETWARDVVRFAGTAYDADATRVWHAIEAEYGDGAPRPGERRTPVFLALAASVVVAMGAVGATVWVSGRGPVHIGPGGGAEPTLTYTTPVGASSTTSPAPPPTPTASPTAIDRKPPLFSGHVSLPPNQRRANYSPTDSGWHVEGTATGVGQVHIDGVLHNVAVVPGSFPNSGGDKAVCLVQLAPGMAINTTGREIVKYESCLSVPRVGGTRLRGLLEISEGLSNHVDEWKGWVVPQLIAAPTVARITWTVEGRTTELQQRFYESTWGGAYFIGWIPDTVPNGDGSFGSAILTYYDKDGRQIGQETID